MSGGAILCGGNASQHDIDQVARFARALAQPTPELTRLEILRQMAESGDGEIGEMLAEHDKKTEGPTL